MNNFPNFGFAQKTFKRTPPIFTFCEIVRSLPLPTGRQKFLPLNPLPFCPPAWASPPKLFGGTAGLFFNF